MRLINLKQNSPEWLRFRKSKIGASDAPCIMGVGFKSAHELYLEKVNDKETIVNQYMKRGRDMEPKALESFINMTGFKVSPAVGQSLEFDWQIASFDGITEDHSVVVEIKCPGERDHALAKDGIIPKKYIPQLQHQLCVASAKGGYYYSFDGEEGVLIGFERDDAYIQELIKKEREFYERITLMEPPESGIKEMVILDDEEWNSVADEYVHIKQEIASLEEKEKVVRERLISIAAERNVNSMQLKLEKCSRKGTIDYAKLPQLKGVDLEPYRKAGTNYWLINLN